MASSQQYAKRTSPQTYSNPQVRQSRLSAKAHETEYVESSHRAILSRKVPTSIHVQSPLMNQPTFRIYSDSRRPTTPVPSLSTSETISPTSISTISPTTPIFRSRMPYPRMDISPGCSSTTLQSSSVPRPRVNHQPQLISTSSDFDPASTYQPRRFVRVPRSDQSDQFKHSYSMPEERSYIDWDDDSTKIQRIKQSLGTLTHPTRPTKTKMPQPPDTRKNFDLNATPRTLLSKRSKKSPSDTTAPHIDCPASRSLPPPVPIHTRTVPIKDRSAFHGHPNRSPSSTSPQQDSITSQTRQQQASFIRTVDESQVPSERHLTQRSEAIQSISPHRNSHDFHDCRTTSFKENKPSEKADSRSTHAYTPRSIQPPVDEEPRDRDTDNDTDGSRRPSINAKPKRLRDLMHGLVRKLSNRDLKRSR